tara:strand:+ start:108 stop:1346 length:1239 start_codon:yes stop_codon:yes gene_type:complete
MSDTVIRSVTFSVDLLKINNIDYQNEVKNRIEIIRKGFLEKKIKLRTLRINIIKLDFSQRPEKYLFLNNVKLLSSFCESLGIRWFNISIDLVNSNIKNIKIASEISLEILKKHKNAFINLIVSDKDKINFNAIKESSKFILAVSKLSHNGYDNFRVGINTNSKSDTPFFPFSFASKELSFSVAIESINLIENLINKNSSKEINLLKIQNEIVVELTKSILLINNISEKLSAKSDSLYSGIDFSLAPYPNEKISVVKLLNYLGLNKFGSNGSLFLTSYFTNILKDVKKNNQIKTTGFNGVMYSLLEDHLLCESNNDKFLSIDQLTLYSTLCACGLDMLPIPGNTLPEEIESIILDIASISSRLNKQLGIRLLPIPNKVENEFTEFDMDFISNTRILNIKNSSFKNDLNYFKYL